MFHIKKFYDIFYTFNNGPFIFFENALSSLSRLFSCLHYKNVELFRSACQRCINPKLIDSIPKDLRITKRKNDEEEETDGKGEKKLRSPQSEAVPSFKPPWRRFTSGVVIG